MGYVTTLRSLNTHHFKNVLFSTNIISRTIGNNVAFMCVLVCIYTIETLPFHYTDLYPCQRQPPCQNGATCINNGLGDYLCQCLDGYEGDTCETETIECYPNPCQNGGTCTVWHYNVYNRSLLYYPQHTFPRMRWPAILALAWMDMKETTVR